MGAVDGDERGLSELVVKRKRPGRKATLGSQRMRVRWGAVHQWESVGVGHRKASQGTKRRLKKKAEGVAKRREKG